MSIAQANHAEMEAIPQLTALHNTPVVQVATQACQKIQPNRLAFNGVLNLINHKHKSILPVTR
jgi:hypothetical protein